MPVRCANSSAHEPISTLTEFTGYGSFKAMYASNPRFDRSSNWLNFQWADQYQNDLRNAIRGGYEDEFYVVFSYQTPIAWLTRSGWVMPNQKHSVTTSRHQSTTRRGIAASGRPMFLDA